MTKFNLILLVFLISNLGCKRTNEVKNNSKPIDELHTVGYIKLNKIPDSKYVINKSEDNNFITFNNSSENSSTTISFRTFEERKFSGTDEFISFAENFMENQMKTYEMKSLHFNVVGFKNTTCLQFDGTFRDSTSQERNKEYIAHDGYLCLPPDNGSTIAEIKVVHYSNEKLMPNDVIYEFQNMVEQLKFTTK